MDGFVTEHYGTFPRLSEGQQFYVKHVWSCETFWSPLASKYGRWEDDIFRVDEGSDVYAAAVIIKKRRCYIYTFQGFVTYRGTLNCLRARCALDCSFDIMARGCIFPDTGLSSRIG